MALTACDAPILDGGRELGWQLDEDGHFGEATRNNIGFHTGELQYGEILAERFAAEVPTTINFAFNSATLDEEARAVLRQQARFIRHFPEVRFSVYGHTDLVGSRAYNQRLGLRRARAAVDFLVSQGVERSRLEALVSLGETSPIVATEERERRNRRTVTEVTGFVQSHPLVLDGEYARIIYRAYQGVSSD
ncbi:OmpA family protein [Roseibacterium beibuensis]|nr:OmpA family protein [Roseibacterium beibuensis]MCS6622289.1 OmpA family protein [Roseibacterium beibuensis]